MTDSGCESCDSDSPYIYNRIQSSIEEENVMDENLIAYMELNRKYMVLQRDYNVIREEHKMNIRMKNSEIVQAQRMYQNAICQAKDCEKKLMELQKQYRRLEDKAEMYKSSFYAAEESLREFNQGNKPLYIRHGYGENEVGIQCHVRCESNKVDIGTQYLMEDHELMSSPLVQSKICLPIDTIEMRKSTIQLIRSTINVQETEQHEVGNDNNICDLCNKSCEKHCNRRNVYNTSLKMCHPCLMRCRRKNVKMEHLTKSINRQCH